MPIETVDRRWTVATWLVAGVGEHLESVVHAVEPLRADAIALQSIGEDAAATVAAALGANVAWNLSYYPRTRLFPGSGIGLAVITPHTIAASHGVVCNGHDSTWSARRRIAQFVTVERHDQTTYAIVHQVGPTDVARAPTGSIPLVTITPEQVGVDDDRAIGLPEDATSVGSTTSRPIREVAPLQVTVFEQPWVRGDYPTLG